MTRRHHAIQIQLSPEHIEAVSVRAKARRVPKTVVYREAVELYLATVPEPASAIPPDATSIAEPPQVIEASAPTRATSKRRRPWDELACTPRVVPGGRRT